MLDCCIYSVSVGILEEEKKMRRRQGNKERGGGRADAAPGIVLLPRHGDAEFTTLLPHSSHRPLVLLCCI